MEKNKKKGKLMKSIVFGPFIKSSFLDTKKGSTDDALVEATVSLNYDRGLRGATGELLRPTSIGPLKVGDTVVFDLYVRIENPK